MDEPLFIEEIFPKKNAVPARFSYLKNIPAVQHILKKGFEFQKPITIFMGENGSGKSTLIEAIAAAYGFNPEGGSKNFSFSTRETHSGLHSMIGISKGWRYPKDGFFLRAESFYNAATYIEELDEIECGAPKITDSYGGISLHCQSHGESFLALAANRFFGNGLYILDEPEAALSPAKQLALLDIIRELSENSQFIIATHSVILSAVPGADVYFIDENGIAPCDYKSTEHYLIMKKFMQAPEKLINRY